MHNTRTAAITLTTLTLATIAPLTACEPTRREVTRVDPDTVIDVDYRFDDEDARQIYRGMVDDALSRPWLTNWIADNQGQRPIVIVGPVDNRTEDYIETNLFTNAIERELLNSGKVRLVGSASQRDDLRAERFQGDEWNSPETRKILRSELGADLMLLGEVNDNTSRSLRGETVVKYYQATLELINIETNEKLWSGIQEIKKTSVLR